MLTEWPKIFRPHFQTIPNLLDESTHKQLVPSKKTGKMEAQASKMKWWKGRKNGIKNLKLQGIDL